MSPAVKKASPWPTVLMNDICQLHYGKSLTASKRRPGGIPVYGSNGVTGWHDRPLNSGPTVILGRKGQGPLGVEWCEGPFWVIDTAYYTSFSDRVFSKFFYYFTDWMGLNHLKDGTSNPSLTRDVFGIQDFPLPPVKEQREIAAVLGALDDKIELNRKMATTLEEMARALYRSWFVDFVPVRAKLEGRAPAHMDAATAALFPDRFDDEGLPEGWEEISIYDVARVQYGAPFKSSLFNSSNEGRPLVRIRDLKNHSPGVSTSEVHKKEYLIQPGDIVVGMDGDFTAYSWSSTPALMNQRVCCFIPHEERNRAFLRYGLPGLLKTEEDAAVATTVIHLGKKDIDKFTLPRPCREIMEAFSQTCGPMVKRIVDIGLENQTLANLRDTLLPRLMSGELRVGEAREQVEGAS